MNDNKHPVCTVEHAGSLDNKIRKFFQNPEKILNPYIQEGVTVLDVGCGPGFFSIDMAKMVGKSGKVVAVDLQEGMLQIIRSKIEGTELESRIKLHKCTENKIGLSVQVDFILLFYTVHEVPDKSTFFRELFSALKPDRQVLIVEPPFHVSEFTFQKTLQIAKEVGFVISKGSKMLFQKTEMLTRV